LKKSGGGFLMKVLVIDDNQDVLDLTTYMLEVEGHEVHTALTGEKGLETAYKIRPDLILLDIMLPGMNGFQICRWMKNDKNLKDSIIFMFTALNMVSDIEFAFRCGADDYITKPFERKYLNDIIKSKLEKKQEKDFPPPTESQMEEKSEKIREIQEERME
jgi:DNA-binding response OmpR family regulator